MKTKEQRYNELYSSGLVDSIKELFANRKERGSELFISRLTLFLGIIFFTICLILGF